MHWNSYFIFSSEKAFNFLLSFLAITSFRNLANAISLESDSQEYSKTNSATTAKLNHELQWTVIMLLGVINCIMILPGNGNGINFIFITFEFSVEINMMVLDILCKYVKKVVIIIQTLYVIHCKILPGLEISSIQIIVNRKSIPRVILSIIPCKPARVYPSQKTWKSSYYGSRKIPLKYNFQGSIFVQVHKWGLVFIRKEEEMCWHYVLDVYSSVWIQTK